jgi:hypothetical protein
VGLSPLLETARACAMQQQTPSEGIVKSHAKSKTEGVCAQVAAAAARKQQQQSSLFGSREKQYNAGTPCHMQTPQLEQYAHSSINTTTVCTQQHQHNNSMHTAASTQQQHAHSSINTTTVCTQQHQHHNSMHTAASTPQQHAHSSINTTTACTQQHQHHNSMHTAASTPQQYAHIMQQLQERHAAARKNIPMKHTTVTF